jgi:lysylphosphatidylglycerol synthetase-like protein (DUF2156 family)
MGSVVEYQELKNRFYVMTFALKLKNNLVDVPLVSQNKRKYLIRMNFITKYLLYQIFNSLTLVTFIMLTLATFLSLYLNGKSFIELVAAILWTILSFIWIINVYSIFTLGLFCWYLFALYLRYAFSDVHNKIVNDFRWGNKSMIIKAFVEHNRVSQHVYRLNEFFKHMVFVLYFFGVPAIEILLYLVHARDSKIYVRFVAGYLFVVLFIGCSLMNYWSARMTTSAHKSYKLMFRVFCSQRMHLTLKERLRVLSFIEKLSGPDIGYYCLGVYIVTAKIIRAKINTAKNIRAKITIAKSL